MIDVRTKPGSDGEASCPLCRETAPETRCRGCETPYHGACLLELGGCSTLGCALRGVSAGVARRLGCGVCGELAGDLLTRRRCGCGATLHQDCVGAHAEACARGRRLLGDGARPATPERRSDEEQRVVGAVVGALVAQGLMCFPASYGLRRLMADKIVQSATGIFGALACLMLVVLVVGPTLDRCHGRRRYAVGVLTLLGLVLLPGLGFVAWAGVLLHFSRVPPDPEVSDA